MSVTIKLIGGLLALSLVTSQGSFSNYGFYNFVGSNGKYLEHNNGSHIKLDGNSDNSKSRFQVFNNGNGTFSFKARKSNGKKRYIKVANNSKLYINTRNRFKSSAQFFVDSPNTLRSKSKNKYLKSSATNIKASVSSVSSSNALFMFLPSNTQGF